MDLYDRLFGDSEDTNVKKKEEPKQEMVNLSSPKAPEAESTAAKEPEIKWSLDFQRKPAEKEKENVQSDPVSSKDAFAMPKKKDANVERALGSVGAALDEMEKAASAPLPEYAEKPVDPPSERHFEPALERSYEKPSERPYETPSERPLEKPVSSISEEEKRTLMRPEEGDDRLFEQIDAFREKAQQLSAIIHSKQTKVANLEALVGEKEAQNRYLHDEVDRLKMQSDKLVIELDSRINGIKERLSADIGDLKTRFLEKADNANAPLMEKVDAMNASFSGMKNEVFDKVHTENLQAYKNVQSFIQENDKSEDNRLKITTEVYKLRKFFGFLIFLGIVDAAGVAFIILHILGLLPW